jgi:hypothetical protein
MAEANSGVRAGLIMYKQGAPCCPDSLWKGTHRKDVVTIGLHTGMKKTELLGLHKAWINHKEGVIIVPRNMQKRKKKDKRAPINSEIRLIIHRNANLPNS